MESLKLLPQKFKWVGISLIVLPFLILILLELFVSKLQLAEYDGFKMWLQPLIILGCALVIISKQKIEDERTNYFRLISFTFSFLTTIFAYIINCFLLPKNAQGFSVIFQLCITYIICFYFLNTGLINKFKKNAK